MIGVLLIVGVAVVFWTGAILKAREIRESGDPR